MYILDPFGQELYLVKVFKNIIFITLKSHNFVMPCPISIVFTAQKELEEIVQYIHDNDLARNQYICSFICSFRYHMTIFQP